MTLEEAKAQAIRVKQYYPYRIVGVVETPHGCEVISGKTKARINNLVRKGAKVYLVS